VSAAELEASGITPTRYSYRSRINGAAYLEEDVDAPAFIAAYAVNPDRVPIQVVNDFEHLIGGYSLVPFASK